MTGAAKLPLRQRPAFWGTMMFISFGIISALRISDAINSTTGFILMSAAMLQIIPLTRASMAKQKSTGHLSPAITRYTRRFMLATFGYMAGLGIAVYINDRVELSQGESFLIALLPVIPIFGMIWSMARYIVEEDDEFLRHRAIMASLFGLGVVLVTGTFWGFLETFGVVPHLDAWWCFPIWAIGMGISQCWMVIRDGKGGD
ncbi:hypothetical protein AMC99_02411 [Altererythrobacter epoxidivorans]|uniref:Uncharacterized protein n=1 Tax=Altererythrobacter epoxidivorans TaxID=361183 RepID=A0A0M3TB14_9SPHN|nr:hypothetical protein [Altererythrobacter epoxidivorans]ALE17686.1 hypothetical protein AMC99_02411 [Altererythrobacter epoxidivorans]